MSDLSGFTAVDPTPGPRRQGTAPDAELEAMLSEYATSRQEPAATTVPPAVPADQFQAPPVAASNAAHLAEIPTGFTMPAVEQVVPGPAPKTFDALVSAEDTFTVPDLPAGFVVPDLTPVAAAPDEWQPKPEVTAWPEPLTFDAQAENPILDDETLPAPVAEPAGFADLFEATTPVAPTPAPEAPDSVVDAVPFEMPEWAGPAEPTTPGESVFTMPEDTTPWQAYEQVEQHSQVAVPSIPPVAVPSVPVAAEYAPFEVAAPPAVPTPAEQAPAAAAWTPEEHGVAASPALPPELAAMFAAATADAPSAAAAPQPPVAPQYEVPQVVPQQPQQFEVPPAVQPPAAPAQLFEVPPVLPQFEVPAAVPQATPSFEVPAAVQPEPVVPLQKFDAPPAVPEPAYEAPAPAAPQPIPAPAPVQPVPQFEAPAPVPVPAPQFQAPPAAPAVPLPPPAAQTPPAAEAALPTGFFDDDFDAPAPAPLPIPAEQPTPTPVAPQSAQPHPAPAPAQPAPVPAPAQPAPQPEELDEANRLVVEAAPVEARIPLSAVGANLRVDEDWLNQVLRQLVALGISDVHLLMSGARGELLIEGRRDGFLEKIRLLSGREATIVLNLVKSGSRISTGSNRVPDDGRYELEIDKFPYQLRAVVTPLFDGGEKVVLRLPQTGQLRPLESLGFTERNLDAVNNLLAIPGGMTLIAGPMGEGKTTTAHAALMRIGGSGKAVMSLEDPVERALFDVAQVEVNEDIGSGFAANMKYLVRSDFDTLFLGEIRDEATASAAVRIAQAGRRVITTIHATNNVTALRKLMQMSEDSALSVLDATRGVISQRLVRRLGDGPDGYLGRHPVHEVLTMSTAVKEALVRDESVEAIESAASATSTTFSENARALLAEGITDEQEIRRVLGNVL